MNIGQRKVSVIVIPGQFENGDQQVFVEQVAPCLEANRPKIVFDCSLLKEVGTNFIQLLIGSLEEAMKRNGDVRLACVRPDVLSLLETTGVAGLVHIFGEVGAAVTSYDPPPIVNVDMAGSELTERRMEVNAR